MPPAATAAGLVGAVEPLEDARRRLRLKARPVVRDLEERVRTVSVARGADAYGDRRARGRVRCRVGEQVAQHLAQPRLVADHDGHAVQSADDLELGAAVGRDDTHVGDCFSDKREEIDGMPVDRALLVEASEQQQVVDQQPHAASFVLDAAHGSRDIGRIGGGALPVELGVATDRGQWSAQLVAGVADKPSHAFLGRACLGLGILAIAEGRLDLAQHRVERLRQPSHLGARVTLRYAVRQVAGGDGLGRTLDLDQRA